MRIRNHLWTSELKWTPENRVHSTACRFYNHTYKVHTSMIYALPVSRCTASRERASAHSSEMYRCCWLWHLWTIADAPRPIEVEPTHPYTKTAIIAHQLAGMHKILAVSIRLKLHRLFECLIVYLCAKCAQTTWSTAGKSKCLCRQALAARSRADFNQRGGRDVSLIDRTIICLYVRTVSCLECAAISGRAPRVMRALHGCIYFRDPQHARRGSRWRKMFKIQLKNLLPLRMRHALWSCARVRASDTGLTGDERFVPTVLFQILNKWNKIKLVDLIICLEMYKSCLEVDTLGPLITYSKCNISIFCNYIHIYNIKRNNNNKYF